MEISGEGSTGRNLKSQQFKFLQEEQRNKYGDNHNNIYQMLALWHVTLLSTMCVFAHI